MIRNELMCLVDGESKVSLVHTVDGRKGEDLGLSLQVRDARGVNLFHFEDNEEAVIVLNRMLRAAQSHRDNHAAG